MSSKVKQVANAAAPVVKRDVNKWLYRYTSISYACMKIFTYIFQ